MKKKKKCTLMDCTGEGYPLAAAVTLILLMLILVITQYAHLMIIASGVKDAMQEAVRSTVILRLQSDGECHASILEGGRLEYQVKDLQVQIHNNGLASGETEHFEITATIRLEVPVSFIQKVLPPMQITVRTKAAYTPKF